MGPDYPLMLDSFHYYSGLEALELANGIAALGYLWMEEPMDEHSMSSYIWLCEQTTLPICGPETARGRCTPARSGSRPALATWSEVVSATSAGSPRC